MSEARRQLGLRSGARGFSLPELLVVTGVIALLIAIMLPPLRAAHRQAQAAQCGGHLQQLGLALENARTDYQFYPVWDDGGTPMRYTWIDLLVQRRYLGSSRVGYCPEDPRPSFVNAARGRFHEVLYPGEVGTYGIDYSYGITVPLSSAGWVWQPDFNRPDDRRQRFLEGYDRYPGLRVLAADSNWSHIYNLSGDALNSHSWSYPSQYDNLVDWRHRNSSANVLFQDGHVGRVVYNLKQDEPVNTSQVFVWYPGESLTIGPDSYWNDNFYPNAAPVNLATGEPRGPFPREMTPSHYTKNLLWTMIENK